MPVKSKPVIPTKKTLDSLAQTERIEVLAKIGWKQPVCEGRAYRSIF